ncbi:MAG: thioredoxin domain-containing protein [Chloroflexota bacterium]|jgi:protein-disulfide isomerase
MMEIERKSLLVGLLIGLFVGALVLYGLPFILYGIASNTKPQASPTADTQLVESVVARTRHFKGDPNAPVTIIEFGDFQCPYCGQFFSRTEPQIYERYIQSGKVRFGYFHFAFLGEESNWAAQAAECAAEQNKFWEYHDKLYNSQSGENQGAFSRDNLKRFADELGLDTSAFSECLDSGRYAQLVSNESSMASSIGVNSTPTFLLVNGQFIIGAQPFEIFQQALDSLLGG